MSSTFDNFNLAQFIDDAATVFEEVMHVRVEPAARESLIRPALAHRSEVESELASGQITLDELREKVMSQLAVAKRIADQREETIFRHSGGIGRRPATQISGADAERSMEEECSYTFWC